MVNKVLKITLLFLFLNIPCFPQAVVNSISFEGNDFLSSNELSGSMVLKEDKDFNQAQFELDLKSIRNRYQEYGFLLASIKETALSYNDDSSYVDITIKIDEGKRIEVGQITIEGNKFISDKKISDIFETKVGNILNDNVLNNDINELLTLYESKGMPFAKAVIKDISIYEDFNTPKINITIEVFENSKIKIDKIKIVGNEVTNDNVILRELKIGEDKIVTRESLQDIKSRLEKLNIFERVEEPKIYTIKNNKTTGLLIEVVEGNTNTFDGILGYVPPADEKESGYFTGLVNLSFRNLFGSARRIDARWEQQVRSTQELEFKYGEPYFFGLPLNIYLGFLQRIQDTTYTRRKVDVEGDILLTDKITITISAGYDRVIPSEDTNRVFVIADSRVFYSGAKLKYDSRDDIYNPGSGIVYRAFYSYGDKKIFNISELGHLGFKENFSVQKYSSELELYLSFFKRQSNLLRFFGGEVRSDKLEDADFFRIGGMKNIRGYREEQFLASKLAYSNVEFRYSLTRKSFAFAFYDFGYYFRPADDINFTPEQKGFLYGYGIGIRLETALGIIGVSYALGKGDSFLDGKIHFGLINEF